ncbi:hypothetical protein [Epibacterium sp. Ofav1-8]|uniref:hypothetical protein n=1 Tax=Epibacterium sp. Ofav1-8 TaxID=2917735 RepID=UPI001EF49CDC|nr:hypothetical protein [Epibacterium sp. Ofav1-8]
MGGNQVALAMCEPEKLLETLNWPKAPSEIWQEPFDRIRGHCERIANTTEPTDLFDFCDFFLDYQYMEVQEDLLAFGFPKALEAWARQELSHPDPRRFKGTWHFEGMWDALAYRPIYPEFFNKQQYRAMTDFFVHVLLVRMGREEFLSFRGSEASPYEWIRLHDELIWLFPVAEQIWDEWWSFKTPGMAVCAVQWLSALLYEEDENPFFEPWNSLEGGGAPNLTRIDHLSNGIDHLSKETAPSANTEFIRSTLTPKWAEGVLARAVEVLSKHESFDLVYTMWLDSSRRSTLFEERARKLLEEM